MELRKYYEDLLDTFSSEGWKHLMEDMGRDLANVNSLDAVSNADELFYRKGQMQVIRAILNYESAARQALEEMDADNS